MNFAGPTTYLFPEQETKLKVGDKVTNATTGEPLNSITSLDEETRRLVLRIGVKREMPDRLSIGPGQPIGTNVLRDALYRFADGLTGQEAPYPALEAILRREPPCVTAHAPGSPLTDETQSMLPQVIDTVACLTNSYLFIQGPPGAGKTWTGSHVIAELLRRGKRIAVASNSHKAINNLLTAVENVATEKSITFRGAKKSNAGDGSCLDGRQIRDVMRADDISNDDKLVAGTAWLFADATFDRAFDILFVDEAGQVTLANLLAMGTCAHNIVLLGDPMQLGQPTQGTHPGQSGESGLEYLLDARATVQPDMGVFLPTTWRMAPAVCTFISEAVYDGRLKPEKHTARQKLVLKSAPDPVLREAGIVFVPVDHEGCSQKSPAEANRIAVLFANLMQQEFIDRDECKRPIGLDDILVVAPYNMQVNLLKQVLPEGARVGTVDKFQGQEAPVVIISMATSSGDDLPRDIGFLFSKNRLNVAISRAQCLAVMVASPKLTAVKCATVEQMALVNLVCLVAEDYPA